MALSANLEVDHYVDQVLRSYQVASSKLIYKGALVGLSPTGYARPLITGDRFLGLAYESMDNKTGADGAVSVRVYTVGDFSMTLAGANLPTIGHPVFATDDATLSFKATGGSYVGIVQDVPVSNTIVLRLDPGRRHVKTVTHAVGDLSAGQDIAARAIHATELDGTVVAVRVVNQATAPAGIDGSNTCVVTVAMGAGTIATETFDGSPAFPVANTVYDFPTISNSVMVSGEILTLTVANGATADPGSFLVEVDYV